jgi:hypothetical protein
MSNDTSWSGRAPAIYSLSRGAVSAAIVALFAPFGILTSPSVRKLLLIIAVLDIAFPLYTHFGYQEKAGALGAEGGLHVSLTTFALAGLYLPLLLQSRYRVAMANASRQSYSRPLALYLFFAALSVLSAGDVTLALYELFLLLQMFLLYHYIANSTAEDVLLVVRFLLIGLLAEGLLMIGLAGGLAEMGVGETRVDDQSVAGVTREVRFLGFKARVDEYGATKVRVGGTIGSPNDAGGYLGMVMAVTLGVLMTPVGRGYKLLGGMALAAGVVALVLTFSRGGWAAFSVGLVFLGLCAWRQNRISWKLSLAVAAVVIVAGVSFSEAVASRLTEDDRGAAVSRVPLMKLAGLMIADHPLLGVGADNFTVAMEPYLTRGFSGEFVYAVHNKYLLIWSETGPGALLAFVWLLVTTMRRGIRCWRLQDPLFSPIALGCVAAVAARMTHMLVDVFRGQPELFLIAGLMPALERCAGSRRT